MDSPEFTKPKNTYQNQLEAQLGKNYADIPPQYKFNNLPESIRNFTNPDNLCGLPIFRDDIRNQMVSKISECIKHDQPFAIIKMDSDQLKSLNNVHRDLGDESIKYSAAHATQELAKLNLTSEHYVARSTFGGDEVIMIFINPSQDELKKIQDYSKQINEDEKKVYIVNKNGKTDFYLSSSSGFVSSNHPILASEIGSTREKLTSNEVLGAYDLFNHAMDIADDKAGVYKVFHEIKRIPTEILTESPTEFKNIIVKTYGGKRISSGALNLLVMMSQLSGNSHAPNITDDIELNSEFADEKDDGTNPLQQIIRQYNTVFKPKN